MSLRGAERRSKLKDEDKIASPLARNDTSNIGRGGHRGRGRQYERGKMKIKTTLIITAVVLLLGLLSGCSSGIPQEEYDRVKAQLESSQSKVSELQAGESQAGELQAEVQKLQNETKGLKERSELIRAQLEDSQAGLEASKAQVTKLQSEIGGLKERYELVGETPAETAENIVKQCHETHAYSTVDFYVCSDMASDVWNMLQAQGIDAMIQIGSLDTTIADINQCNHAWVLAEVSPGEYLALEATGGYVVPKGENELYYKGWSFDNPKDFKRYSELRREYNIMVDVISMTLAEAQEVAKEHDQATNQSTADKLKAVYDKLVELMDKQEAEMKRIESEWSGLATKR